jgi:hypothetical protein
VARFQDHDGPLERVGIFHQGRLIREAYGDAQRDTELRNQLDTQYPGCEVLARCNTHPDTAAVDCLDCWPLDQE